MNEKITVYNVQLKGFNGPVVHTDLRLALEEVKELLTEDTKCVVTVEKTSMTKDEIDKLPEFEGY